MIDCAMIELSEEIIRQALIIKNKITMPTSPEDLKKASIILRNSWNNYKLECERSKNEQHQEVLDDVLDIATRIMSLPNYPFDS